MPDTLWMTNPTISIAKSSLNMRSQTTHILIMFLADPRFTLRRQTQQRIRRNTMRFIFTEN
ncbi:Uncharacterised protein [Salmonella enterica subsp. enterica serovar Typhi]|nr:Uncharacterised protein [Salmonella enterica subsp. enterica serovar Typhi]CHX28046.1 Uncharacterised protein [Salmonella enterica subsp. enterica serovar Typhi]CIM08132.1 Uncharacterised protein [Salmonella enterica subsp. enterica serovar Typhi]